jgi:hypothetical protein
MKADSLGDTVWVFKDSTALVDTVETTGYYVQQTSDGGYVAAGSYRESRGGYLVKVDSLGDLQWRQVYGFGKGLGCVDQTADGGYIATGRRGSPFSGIWVVRADSVGDTVWTKTIEGYSSGTGHWIAQLPDSTFAVVGDYYAGAENWSVCLSKLASSGDLLWTVSYASLTYLEDYWPGCADLTQDGGYIILGRRGIVRVDSVGDIVWSTNGYYANSSCIEHTYDSGYVFLGEDTTYPPSHSIVKLSSVGDSVWTRKLPPHTCYYLQQTSDSGYVVTGQEHPYYMFLLKADPTVGAEDREAMKYPAFDILQIAPSPAVSHVCVSYCIDSRSYVELSIHDISGRLVDVLDRGEKTPGVHKQIWNTDKSLAGIYFCVLWQGKAIKSRKIVVPG